MALRGVPMIFGVPMVRHDRTCQSVGVSEGGQWTVKKKITLKKRTLTVVEPEKLNEVPGGTTCADTCGNNETCGSNVQ